LEISLQKIDCVPKPKSKKKKNKNQKTKTHPLKKISEGPLPTLLALQLILI
jgi:hypothetical protein